MTSRTPFISRKRELKLLDKLWQSKRSELLVLYGRRRVGKTRLLTHWLKKAQSRCLYWVAEPTSAHDQLRSFSRALLQFANPEAHVPEAFTYVDWPQALQQLGVLAEHERLAVFIDEFTYLLEINPGISGTFQIAWDHQLKETNCLLGLSGAHLGMMQRGVLSYQAPLYGRETAILHLKPLRFSDTPAFFPRYSPAERVAVYSMLGGIPAYWEQFDPDISVSDNIQRRFLAGYHLLEDEPRLLLQDFLSDLHNYVAILRAIARDYRTPSEIARNAGLDSRQISMYLRNLVDTGFVVRQLPVTAKPKSRLGRHHITDPFLRFYFRFLSHRQSQLALGISDQALKEIKKHLRDFIGAHTWEEICREWTLLGGSLGQLPLNISQTGSIWTRNAQIDVAGIDTMEKSLILGECKWSAHRQGKAVLAELVSKAAEVVPKNGNWKVYFLGFARSGWTQAAKAFSGELDTTPPQGENWEAVGMQLLDLEQVDKDLGQWSSGGG